jgi:hypothetical protein
MGNDTSHRTLRPALIVHGNKDIVVTPINAFILAEHLQNAQLIMYPDSNHGAQYQHRKPQKTVPGARKDLLERRRFGDTGPGLDQVFCRVGRIEKSAATTWVHSPRRNKSSSGMTNLCPLWHTNTLYASNLC